MNPKELEPLVREVWSSTSRLIEIVRQTGQAEDRSMVLGIDIPPDSVLVQYTPAEPNVPKKLVTLYIFFNYSRDSPWGMKLLITANIRNHFFRGLLVEPKFVLESGDTSLKLMPRPFNYENTQRFYLKMVDHILNTLNA